jgi:predicted permease
MGELPSIFAETLAPVFAVVAGGWLAGRRMCLDPRPMARVAYFLLAPAFIFEVLAASTLRGSTVWRMVAVLSFTTLVAAGIGFVAGRALRRPTRVIAALVLVAAYGNVGNFGLPIVAFEFGPEALDLAGVAFLTVNVLAFLIGVTAATWDRLRPSRAVLTAVTTPAVLVVPFAVLVNRTEVSLPVAADRAIGLLADAMIPVMLLTLGMHLAQMQRPRLGVDVLVGSGIRLLLAPAIAGLGVVVVGLDGDPAGVSIVQSAMPAAVFTALIALEHDMEPDLVTTVVLVSTIASALTLGVVLALV